MTQRRQPLHSPILRQAARGRACTLRLPGHCVGGTDTTVLAHLYWGPKATGGKGDDLIGAYTCVGCHAALDGYKVTGLERYEAMGRGLAETLQLVLDAGLVQVVGEPPLPIITMTAEHFDSLARKPRTKAKFGGGKVKRESPTATPGKIAAQKRGLAA